jgi:hypothetical protein
MNTCSLALKGRAGAGSPVSDHHHERGQTKKFLSFKERARVRMGSTDHDNSPHPHPALPLKGRERVFAREVL